LTNPNEPPYWQAVAGHFLSQWLNEPDARNALVLQLKAEHPLVREYAARSLEPAIGYYKLLDDPLTTTDWTTRSANGKRRGTVKQRPPLSENAEKRRENVIRCRKTPGND